MDFQNIFEALQKVPQTQKDIRTIAQTSQDMPLQRIGADVESFAKWQLTFQAISAISASIVAILALSAYMRKR
jgi:hypothetical protein